MRGAWAVATRPLPPVPTLANSRTETVLPSPTPTSIVAVVFGHRPAVRSMVSEWEKTEYRQSCNVVSADEKTCQINTWQWEQPNEAGRQLRFHLLTGNLIIQWIHRTGYTTYVLTNRVQDNLGQRVGYVFVRRDFKLSTMATVKIGRDVWLSSQCVLSYLKTTGTRPKQGAFLQNNANWLKARPVIL